MSQTIIIELGEDQRADYEALAPEEVAGVIEAAELAVRKAVTRAARVRRYAAMSPGEAAAEFERICEAASAGLTDADREMLAAEVERMS